MSSIPLSVRVGLLAAILGLAIPMLLEPMRSAFVSDDSDGLVPAAFDMFEFHVNQPVVAGLVVFLLAFLAVVLHSLLVRQKILPMV